MPRSKLAKSSLIKDLFFFFEEEEVHSKYQYHLSLRGVKLRG